MTVATCICGDNLDRWCLADDCPNRHLGQALEKFWADSRARIQMMHVHKTQLEQIRFLQEMR